MARGSAVSGTVPAIGKGMKFFCFFLFTKRSPSLSRRGLGLGDEAGGFGAFDLGDIILIFQ